MCLVITELHRASPQEKQEPNEKSLMQRYSIGPAADEEVGEWRFEGEAGARSSRTLEVTIQVSHLGKARDFFALLL